MSAAPAAASTGQPPTARKGGAAKWIVLALVAILLIGGGIGGYWFFVVRPQAAAHETEDDESGEVAVKAKSAKGKKGKRQGGAALRFDPFVVNLADAGGTRYLRLGLSLVIDGDEHEAKELEENRVKLLRIRSAVLDLLGQQLADHVVTPEGKRELREAIEEIANDVLAPTEVTDVLFTEFVVQF